MLSRHLRIKKYFYFPVSASNFFLNFYARFLFFSRETTLLVSASGRLRGEAYPQSPPAGALLLKKKNISSSLRRSFNFYGCRHRFSPGRLFIMLSATCPGGACPGPAGACAKGAETFLDSSNKKKAESDHMFSFVLTFPFLSFSSNTELPPVPSDTPPLVEKRIIETA